MQLYFLHYHFGHLSNCTWDDAQLDHPRCQVRKVSVNHSICTTRESQASAILFTSLMLEVSTSGNIHAIFHFHTKREVLPACTFDIRSPFGVLRLPTLPAIFLLFKPRMTNQGTRILKRTCTPQRQMTPDLSDLTL